MGSSFAKRTSRLHLLLASAICGAIVGAAWSRLRLARGTGISRHSWHDFLLSRERGGFPPGIMISIVLFALFSIYWEAAAKNSAETRTEESKWSRGIHVTLVTVAQALLLLPVPGLRARVLPSTTILVAAGVVLEIAFLAFAVWARQLLGRNWSGAVAIKVDQQLIRSGPYRFVRHPIYSGMLGAYVSIALISGELHALLGVVLVFAAYWRKIRLEEQYLSSVFGPTYAEYQADVSAVIPGLW